MQPAVELGKAHSQNLGNGTTECIFQELQQRWTRQNFSQPTDSLRKFACGLFCCVCCWTKRTDDIVNKAALTTVKHRLQFEWRGERTLIETIRRESTKMWNCFLHVDVSHACSTQRANKTQLSAKSPIPFFYFSRRFSDIPCFSCKFCRLLKPSCFCFHIVFHLTGARHVVWYFLSFVFVFYSRSGHGHRHCLHFPKGLNLRLRGEVWNCGTRVRPTQNTKK